MDTHKNAPLTPKGREVMVRAVVEEGLTRAATARKFNVSAKTVAKWVERYGALGVEGLRDRSSRPHSLPSQTPPATRDAVERLRRQRYTQPQIAALVGISQATVSRILKRCGLSLLSALEPQEPRPRYERATPGELVHLDIKKLGRFNAVGRRITGDKRQPRATRGVGFEFVHVAIDDHSRVATAAVFFPDEKKESAVAALLKTVADFARHGVSIDRVMTDNGSCYRSKAFAGACRRLGIKHIMTKPYTPQTNGKAERFIQSALREWAYATAFDNSDQRCAALPIWLHRYNWHRPHASLAKNTPISRLRLTRNNVLHLHS
jgi:transposase InsO family protein